jgi:hypothetical protein
MKEDFNAVYYLLAASGTLLVAVSGFFFKSLINKLDSGNKLLTELDKQVALLIKTQEVHNSRITSMDNDSRKLTQDVSFLKNKIKTVASFNMKGKRLVADDDDED